MGYTKILIKDNTRIYVTDATDIAQEAMDRHQTLPLPSLALATSIATFSVFASYYQEGRTSVKLGGQGPLGSIIVEAKTNGDIRALVGNPNVASEYDKSKFNEIPLTLGIGDKGTIKVVREVEGVNFGGEVPLANGDVVTDLAYYFDQSEQVNTAIISDVRLKSPEKLERAYSVYIQMLPEHNENDIKWVESFLSKVKLSKYSLEEYISKLEAKELTTNDIRWKCTCSEEKMAGLVKLISTNERKQIIKEHGAIKITCNFCNKKYEIAK